MCTDAYKFVVFRVCYPVHCDPTAAPCAPVSLEHGSVRMRNVNGIPLKADLTCDVGYQLVPKQPMLLCDHGYWTPTVPICKSPGG